MKQLELPDTVTYRALLERNTEEWKVLDDLCGVTISRFYRDRAVWDTLRHDVLPVLAESAMAAGEHQLSCWSVGCASGEEPYTLALAWSLSLSDRYGALALRVLATDVDEHVLRRARLASYAPGTLRELPPEWVARAFEQSSGLFRLQAQYRDAVELRREDVRSMLPDATYRLILCRNSVFTYFGEDVQKETLARLLSRLADGGAFVIGSHERLPTGASLEPWYPRVGIYRRTAAR